MLRKRVIVASFDVGQPYVCKMDSEELWGYFCKVDRFTPEQGEVYRGMMILFGME